MCVYEEFIKELEKQSPISQTTWSEAVRVMNCEQRPEWPDAHVREQHGLTLRTLLEESMGRVPADFKVSNHTTT